MVIWGIGYIYESFLIWIIPSTYLSYKFVNWVCTAGFAIFTFIGFYFGFMVISLSLLCYICLHPGLTTWVILHWSPALIILYHVYFLLDITYYFSACSYMFVLTTRFSLHIYDSDLSIRVCLSLYTTWHSQHYTLGSFWLPESSSSDPRAWSLWILLVAD